MSGELRDKKRKYFIAYNYREKNGTSGVACRMVETSLPISDWEDIMTISDDILSSNPDMESVAISNWRRFEDPE